MAEPEDREDAWTYALAQVLDKNRSVVCRVYPDLGRNGVVACADTINERGRLIAAAPELRAGLRAAHQWILVLLDVLNIDAAETSAKFSASGPSGERELAQVTLSGTLSQIDAALAKAEGRKDA